MNTELPDKIKEKIDNLFIEPEGGQTLNAKELSRKLKNMKQKYNRKNKERKIDCVASLKRYCVEKYSVTFPEQVKPKPTKAGVIVFTEKLELLLIHYYGELQLPKGKRDDADVSLKATGYRELREETGLELPCEEEDANDSTIVLKMNGARVLFFVETGVDCSKVDFTHTLDNEVDGVVLVPVDKLRHSSSRVRVRSKSGRQFWRSLKVCAHIHDLIGQMQERFTKNEKKDDENASTEQVVVQTKDNN